MTVGSCRATQTSRLPTPQHLATANDLQTLAPPRCEVAGRHDPEDTRQQLVGIAPEEWDIARSRDPEGRVGGSGRALPADPNRTSAPESSVVQQRDQAYGPGKDATRASRSSIQVRVDLGGGSRSGIPWSGSSQTDSPGFVNDVQCVTPDVPVVIENRETRGP